MNTKPHADRPAFLDDLAPDAVLQGTVLREPVTGTDAIVRVVNAVGRFYAWQKPTFRGEIGTREFLEYEAGLTDGLEIQGQVALTRNAQGKVIRIDARHAPLGAVLSLSSSLSALLADELGRDLFL